MGDSRHTPIEAHLGTIFEVARRTATGMGANTYEADEVAQLTVFKLWRGWDRPSLRAIRLEAVRWRAYIRQVARNTHVDLIRAHQRRIARQHRAFEERNGYPPGTSEGGGAAPVDTTGIDAWLAQDTIAREIDRLPVQQRRVAARIFLEDRSVAEVAEELGLQPQTVRKHARAARETLRTRLSETEPQHL
jgi:RNA polymerase sigma factor (sigma-70 family)